MIKLVIFDFSGTLAYCPPKEYQQVFSKLRDFNLPLEESQIAKLEESISEYLSESSSWKDLADKIIQKLGMVLEADRRESLEIFLSKKLACKLYNDVEDILSLPQNKAILTLSAKFIVSSIPELKHFEIFSPEVIGVQKPDLKAFLAVLGKMGVDPREAAMVGDSLEKDIFPAKAIGVKPILIDRSGQFADFNDPEIIKIASLKELKKYL